MRYATDLNNDQWALLKPFFAPVHNACRPRKHSTREVLNAIAYVLKTGCQWHMLPADFPPYRVVHYHFMRWQKRGDWARALHCLHETARKLDHRNSKATLGIMDSQSSKSASKKGLVGTTRERK